MIITTAHLLANRSNIVVSETQLIAITGLNLKTRLLTQVWRIIKANTIKSISLVHFSNKSSANATLGKCLHIKFTRAISNFLFEPLKLCTTDAWSASNFPITQLQNVFFVVNRPRATHYLLTHITLHLVRRSLDSEKLLAESKTRVTHLFSRSQLFTATIHRRADHCSFSKTTLTKKFFQLLVTANARQP